MKKRYKENLLITYKLILLLISLMMVVYLILKK